MEQSDPESEHRTELAAERTWLAWWRTAIAAAVAGLGVGRLLPEVVAGTNLHRHGRLAHGDHVCCCTASA